MADTIAAAATPRCQVRSALSASAKRSAAAPAPGISPCKGRTLPSPAHDVRRHLYPEGLRIDEGLAVYMPGPASYTGEDTAEIYCHGSPGIEAVLLDALFAAGARQAEPGEFTRRAF